MTLQAVRARLTVALLAAGLLAGATASRAEPPRAGLMASFAPCEVRFASDPASEASAECFFVLGRDPARAGEAVRRVEALLRHHPRHPWLLYELGRLEWNDKARAEGRFRQAAAAFAERRDADGEVQARSRLYAVLLRDGRRAEAQAEVETARRLAEASGLPLTRARARVLEANELATESDGGNLRRAWRLLQEAQTLLPSDAPYALRRDGELWLGNVALSLGRAPEAQAHYRRMAELTTAEHDLYSQAIALHGLLRALRDELAEMPHPGGRAEALELGQRALAAARASGNREVESKVRGILGQLATGTAAQQDFARCFEGAETVADRSYCRSAQARSLAAVGSADAWPAIEQAQALARESTDARAIAYAWRERMRVSWKLRPTGPAVEDSLAALDAFEALRDLQPSSTGRAELLATLSSQHYWLAGRLGEAALADGRPPTLALAFSVMERLRARTLLEAVERTRAAPVVAQAPPCTGSERAERLGEISQVQRHLLDPVLPAVQREAALATLRRLEREEEELRERLYCVSLPTFSLQAPDFASLSQVERALAPDEALLSFQIAPWRDMVDDFAGGSWVLVATAGGSRLVPLRSPLADRTGLRPAVALFTGLVERADGSEGPAAAGLYQALLGDALAGLPAGIDRLTIVPDDALHQLAFAALREAPAGEPLAARYQLSMVPSATLWLRWRQEPAATAERPVLALADPLTLSGIGTLGGTTVPLAGSRAATLATPLMLGALPYSRREGLAAVRHLGGRSLVLLGEDASEDYFKHVELGRFGLLHFAAHAVVDEENPERSGVLLAPGSAREDGLLQLREIADLPLAGRIAVLSSCRSAAGQVLRGEGVMSLARAFFQAKASAVVASLWPLRDDDGAALFDRFYAHLAEGSSLAAALRAAQLDRQRAGAPAFAWAGVVVLGNGDRVPLPGGRRPWEGKILPLLLLAGIGLAVAGGVAWRRRYGSSAKLV